MYIKKKPPRRIHYRCYKNYKDDFRYDLLNCFEAFDEASMNYQDFKPARTSKIENFKRKPNTFYDKSVIKSHNAKVQVKKSV